MWVLINKNIAQYMIQSRLQTNKKGCTAQILYPVISRNTNDSFIKLFKIKKNLLTMGELYCAIPKEENICTIQAQRASRTPPINPEL